MAYYKAHIFEYNKLPTFYYSIGVIVLATLLSIKANSQTTTNNNFAGNPAFLGWGTGQQFPLIIEHKGPRGINFVVNNDSRLFINRDGGVGLSNFYTAGVTQRLRLASSDNRRGIDINSAASFIPNNIVGGLFECEGGKSQNVALIGEALDGLGVDNAGVYGEALPPGELNIAILAQLGLTTLGFAGYFNGDMFHSGAQYGPSDENLKENIVDLSESHIEALLSVTPKKYHLTDETNHLNFDNRQHFGFIAQEIQDLFPSTVHSISTPTNFDAEENLISETIDHLSIDYTQYIALMTNLYQHQDDILVENENKLDSLEHKLIFLRDLMLQIENSPKDNQKIAVNDDSHWIEDISVYPNPTFGIITVEFKLKTDEKITFTLHNSVGKLIVSHSEFFSAGIQQYPIDTSNLPRGFYELTTGAEGKSMSIKILKK